MYGSSLKSANVEGAALNNDPRVSASLGLEIEVTVLERILANLFLSHDGEKAEFFDSVVCLLFCVLDMLCKSVPVIVAKSGVPKRCRRGKRCACCGCL